MNDGGARQMFVRRVATRRQALKLAAIGTSSAAIFAACGRGKGGSSNTATSSQASKPQSGGQINFKVAVDPVNYDPAYNGKSTPGDSALGQAYAPLLAFKTGPDVQFSDQVLIPNLAQSWQASPDATTYTFHLRQGAKWQNLPPVNGREITSADVQWTAQYHTRTGPLSGKKLPKSMMASFYQGLTSVETPDKYTAVFHFAKPFVPFVNYTASNWNPVLPKEVFDQYGDYKDHIIGAGPFQLDTSSVQKGTSYIWKRNPDYWDAEHTYLDSIRWLVIPDDAAAFAAFTSKQVDILESLQYSSFQQVQRSSPGAKFLRHLQPQALYLELSQEHPGPLTDLRVRQAFNFAIDRDEVNKVLAGGQGSWALPGAIQGLFTDAEAHQMLKQDVQQAKQLMAAAGYANSEANLNWPIENDLSTDDKAWFQLVQAQVKRAGINIQFQVSDKAAQRVKRDSGAFDIDFIGSLGQLEADPDSALFGLFDSNGSTNHPKVKDPELDKLLEAQRAEVDPAKRKDIMRQAVKRILDQMWGISFIYPPIWSITQPYVQNYYPHFSIRAAYTQAWLTK